MFACDSLKISGAPNRRQAVMLEFRNDLLLQKEWRKRVVEKLADAICSSAWPAELKMLGWQHGSSRSRPRLGRAQVRNNGGP